MHTLSLTWSPMSVSLRQTVSVFLVFLTALLLIANAALVGFAVSVRAEHMRIASEGAHTHTRIAELELQANVVQALSPAAARDRGFVSPASFSYAMVRPLGVVPLRGVGDASFNGL